MLRRELKCWHNQCAVSAPRDPMGPLHPSLALAGHQFAEHLRADRMSSKNLGSGNAGASTVGADPHASVTKAPLSVDETVQALKHLLAKERQATTALHSDLEAARAALQESSDALQESLEHRASLQRLLRGVLDHCVAKGVSVPPHLTGRSGKPVHVDRFSQQQAGRLASYDGAGASEPFEQP